MAIAAKGLINILSANQDVESKTVRSATISRALAYIQDEIKSAKAITQENCPNNSNLNSAKCMKLTLPDNSTVFYGYKDISNSAVSSVFLKPGLLLRQEYDSSGSAVLPIVTPPIIAWDEEYSVIADGLISGSETNQPTDCSQDGVNWSNTNTTVYGGDK